MGVKWKPSALAEDEGNGGHRLNCRAKGRAFNDQHRPSEWCVGSWVYRCLFHVLYKGPCGAITNKIKGFLCIITLDSTQ